MAHTDANTSVHKGCTHMRPCTEEPNGYTEAQFSAAVQNSRENNLRMESLQKKYWTGLERSSEQTDWTREYAEGSNGAHVTDYKSNFEHKIVQIKEIRAKVGQNLKHRPRNFARKTIREVDMKSAKATYNSGNGIRYLRTWTFYLGWLFWVIGL